MLNKKWKSKPYLKWVASHQCILCMYHECQAHHITIAEKRGISQKVSDFWTIPLKLGIDPKDIATKFYELWLKDDKNNMEYVQTEIYDKLLPSIKSNIDFLMQVKY